MTTLRERARRFWPEPTAVGWREQGRAAAGAALGILFTAALSFWLVPQLGLNPLLLASVGASAVLVFALPTSPLAQPWPVVGGNLVAAASGLVCAWAIPQPALAAGCAVGLTIGLMFRLRCLHPPGGGTAVLAVLMHGQALHLSLTVVLLNALWLVLAGVAYNSLTGRRYPHGKAAAAPAQPPSRFTAADLDAALAHTKGGLLGVSRDDLEEVLNLAEAAAFQRQLGQLRCAAIMSRDPITGSRNESVGQALAQMRAKRIKALPVVDAQQHLVGIVTRADLRSGDESSDLGTVMTRRVRVARHDSFVLNLLPLFSEGGHHHIPIVDADTRVVGIITQSDFVRALHRAIAAG
jgi:CBS domain-containing membrane protein